MAITYVGGRSGSRAGATSTVAVAINSGLTGGSGSAAAAGDLVVVTVSVGTAGRAPALNISTPSGYTALTAQRTTATSFDVNVQTCYKVMGSTPDTSVTIPSTGNVADGQAYTIQVFRGVNPVTPMDVTPTYANQSGVSNIPDPAAITPVTAGAWIVVCAGGAHSATTAYTASYLTNFRYANGVDTNDGAVGSGYYTGWTSGAYNPAAFGGGTVNSTFSWGATTLALRPVVTHTNTGVLAGTGATLAGTARRDKVHSTSGILAGTNPALAGAADRVSGVVNHATSGTLSASTGNLSGTAARTRAHPASGTLTAPAGQLSGTAARTRLHTSSGGLAGAGATLAGAAFHSNLHQTSGNLAAAPGGISGLASRTRLHPTSGDLVGGTASLSGLAAISVTHDTSGNLTGSGAELSGSATGPLPPLPPSRGGGGGGGGGRELQNLTKSFEKSLKRRLRPDGTIDQNMLESVWTELAQEGVVSPAEASEKLRKLRRDVEDVVILAILSEF